MLYSDHLVVVIVAIALPIAGYVGFRRLLARRLAGVPVDRLRLYRNTMIAHGAMACIVGFLWSETGRDPRELGLAFSGGSRFIAGAVIVAVVLGLLTAQLVSVMRAGQDTMDRLSRQFGRMALIVPHTGREMMLFNGVSVSAGIVEELIWRGYLIWYLAHFVSVEAAALAATLGFGIAHGYQGWRNIPKIMLIGALFAFLYLLSGSIWLSMFLHVAVDLMQGRLAYEVSRRSTNGLAETL